MSCHIPVTFISQKLAQKNVLSSVSKQILISIEPNNGMKIKIDVNNNSLQHTTIK